MRLTMKYIIVIAVLLCFTAACGFKRKAYENPIAKDTQQPDKILFDKAVNDIEHGRYEVARLTLNTLINTYDTSEYLAKAKLAIGDSWYRQGGSTGFALFPPRRRLYAKLARAAPRRSARNSST